MSPNTLPRHATAWSISSLSRSDSLLGLWVAEIVLGSTGVASDLDLFPIAEEMMDMGQGAKTKAMAI